MGGNVGGFGIGADIGTILVVAVLAGTLFTVLVVFQRSRATLTDATERMHADVATGLRLLAARIDALAAALGGPGPGASPDAAAEALADARNRLTAARELRNASPALPVSRRCRWILLEGLAAAHTGLTLAGADAGPRPPRPTEAPLIDAPVRVAVSGREYVARPAYAPGFPHCYSGGLFDVAEIPGGWYAEPFWERLLEAGAAPLD